MRMLMIISCVFLAPIHAMHDPYEGQFLLSDSDDEEGAQTLGQLLERCLPKESDTHACKLCDVGTFALEVAQPLRNLLVLGQQVSANDKCSVRDSCLISCLARDGSNASFACLGMLLALGVLPDGIDCGFQTPAHWAAHNNDEKIMQLLLGAGAKCNLYDENPDYYDDDADVEKPWQIAVRLGHEKVLTLLLKRGVMAKDFEAHEAIAQALIAQSAVQDS